MKTIQPLLDILVKTTGKKDEKMSLSQIAEAADLDEAASRLSSMDMRYSKRAAKVIMEDTASFAAGEISLAQLSLYLQDRGYLPM